VVSSDGEGFAGEAIRTAKEAADNDSVVAFGRFLGAANRLEYVLGRAVEEECGIRHPDAELLVAAQIGGKVARGEMQWG
jgi:hypothetical protein